MGIGWSFIAGASIERLTVRGLPTYTNADLFFAGGELVKIPSSPFHRSRYEGQFMRYRWHQSSSNDQQGYWTGEHPDGTIDYYGADYKGKVDTTSHVYGDKGTFRWELRARVDRNGNRIEYHYTREGQQVYLERVEWVFSKEGKPLYKAELKYESRPDPISDCKPGFDLDTKKRLQNVTIYSETQRIRSYEFKYDVDSGLSRLIQVTRYGTDASKAHPVKFAMKYSEATFSEANSRLVAMNTSVGQNFKAGNSDLIDMNGDGLPDVVNTTDPVHKFHINVLTLDDKLQQKEHDFPASNIVENPKSLSAKLSNPSVQMLDANGDGFTDMVDAVNKLIYINKGNSKWEDNSEALKSIPSNLGSDPNLRFFDYDGDKKIDIIQSTGSLTTYWVNDGKGSWNQIKGTSNIGSSFEKDKLRLIDINGDGLMDAVLLLGGTLKYKKYYGFGKWSDWIILNVPGLADKKLGDKPQFADINGDGMADMVAFVGKSIVYFVNKNGVEFSEGQDLAKFKGIDIPDSSSNSIRIADMNGNGSRDIVWITDSGKFTYLELFSKRPNLLTEISNGIGQRINVEYGSSVYHFLRDKSCNPSQDKGCAGPWQNKLPMAFTVVNQITTWASRSDKPTDQKTPSKEEAPKVQNIYYHHGYYDGTEKQFRGFRHVQSIQEGDTFAESRKDEIFFNVGDTDQYFHGKLEKRVVSNDKGHIYFEETSKWKECSLTGIDKGLTPPVRYICMESTDRLIKEGESDKASWKSTRQEYTYDGFGNLTLLSNLGEKDKQGDELYTKRTFITPKDPNNSNSKWFLRFASKAEFCSDLNKPCSESRLYYDGEALQGLPLGEIDKGNLSRVTVKTALDNDTFLTVYQRKYDDYGNSVEVVDPKGGVRQVTWDPVYHRFSTKETVKTDKLSYSASTEWDYRQSKVVRSVDFNNHVTTYNYDEFGRLVSMLRPGYKPDKPTVTYQYVLEAPISRIIVSKRASPDASTETQQVKCFDGTGRILSQLNRVEGARYLVTNHVSYSSRGTEAQNWQTYESDNTCKFTPPNEVKATQFHVDGLLRQVKKTYPDGGTHRQVYQPMKQTVYDREDNRKDSPHADTPTLYWMDGLQRLVERHEVPKKGETIITKYGYNNVNYEGNSLLTSVTLPNGSIKTQNYDLLGRIIQSVDPDRGTSKYSYDSNGNLLSYEDARGAKTLYTYDQLNRVLTRQQDGKPETKVTYSYDQPTQSLPTATNVKGQLARITYPHGSYDFSYDRNGNVIESRHTLLGTTYSFKRTYDEEGKLLDETFPDGRKVSYEWDAMGRLLKIPGKVESITYNANGTIASWKFANGVTTTRSYDVLRRMTKISVNDGKVMQLGYQFDHMGNVMQLEQKHGDNSYTNSYSYDGIYRLTQAKLNNDQETLSYEQNQLGNLMSKTSSMGDKSPAHIGVYAYDTKKVHALTQAMGLNMVYDNIGQMEKGPNTMKWDYMGRRVALLKESKTIGQYGYNMDGDRVFKEENQRLTLYVDKNYEIRDGQAIIYIRFGPDRVAAWSSVKGALPLFDDLAPAEGNDTLTPKADGQITSGDAWLYHASKTQQVKIETRQRPNDINLTRTMLRASLKSMLNTDDTTHYFHSDHLGSVRAITNSSGNVVTRQAYYPYGEVRSQEGQASAYGYMGTERDEVTKENYFGNRYLNPRLGRWDSPDKLFSRIQGHFDEFNSYGFVKNNPLRYRDLDGNMSIEGTSLIVITSGYLLFQIYRTVRNVQAFNKETKHINNPKAAERSFRYGQMVGRSTDYANPTRRTFSQGTRAVTSIGKLGLSVATIAIVAGTSAEAPPTEMIIAGVAATMIAGVASLRTSYIKQKATQDLANRKGMGATYRRWTRASKAGAFSSMVGGTLTAAGLGMMADGNQSGGMFVMGLALAPGLLATALKTYKGFSKNKTKARAVGIAGTSFRRASVGQIGPARSSLTRAQSLTTPSRPARPLRRTRSASR